MHGDTGGGCEAHAVCTNLLLIEPASKYLDWRVGMFRAREPSTSNQLQRSSVSEKRGAATRTSHTPRQPPPEAN